MNQVNLFQEETHDIAELQADLSKAQRLMRGASKDNKNPFFNSKYADLDSVLEAFREPLGQHGLSLTQSTFVDPNSGKVYLKTKLRHSSGQWTCSIFPVDLPAPGSVEIDKYGKEKKVNVMQATGSILTYLKRYSAMGLVGIAPKEDDDGNSSNFQNKEESTQQAKPPAPTIITKQQSDELRTALNKCTLGLRDNINDVLKKRGLQNFNNIEIKLFDNLMQAIATDIEAQKTKNEEATA